MYPVLSPPASKGFKLCLHAEEPEETLALLISLQTTSSFQNTVLPTVINQIPAVDKWEQRSLPFPEAGKDRASLAATTSQERQGKVTNIKYQPG